MIETDPSAFADRADEPSRGRLDEPGNHAASDLRVGRREPSGSDRRGSDRRGSALRTRCLALAFTVLAAAPARAGDVEIVRLDGRTVSGRLSQWAPAILLQTDGGEQVLAWSEVLSVAPAQPAEAPAPRRPEAPLRFELIDGTSFAGRIESDGRGTISACFRDERRTRLDLNVLRSIVATDASEAALAPLREAATARAGGEDVAVVYRDARVIVLRGAARGLDASGVQFAWNQRELTLPWERTAGLVVSRPPAGEVGCLVRMLDGDVFAGRVVGGDTATLTLASRTMQRLTLDWAEVERIDCRSPRLDFLSDLEPVRYDFTPMFSKRWPLALDRSLTGQPIHLGGRSFSKGVCLHSQAEVAYNLRGEYGQLAALVGISDEMEARGDVDVLVRGDGRVLWEARGVRGGAPPRELLADVSGVHELTIEVRFGADLDLSDHLCLAFARLIRAAR
jgi:hypothetical protein